jgi:hypothetical protein
VVKRAFVVQCVDVVARHVYDRGRTAWRTKLTVWACLLAAVAGAPAASAPQVEPALWSRLRRIETAFRDGDAQALRALLPSEAKVRVDLRGMTDGPRSYGPGQLQVVFAQIFAAHEAHALAFQPEEVKTAAGTAFARARWSRTARGGAPAVDHVTFTLRAQEGDWRIHEILCSR